MSGLQQRPNSQRISSKKWYSESEQRVCEQLAIDRATFYQSAPPVAAGLNRMNYELMRCRERGMSLEETADWVHCSEKRVRRCWERYPAGSIALADIPEPEPYQPRQRKSRREDIDVQALLRNAIWASGGTIGAAVGPDAYEQMMERAYLNGTDGNRRVGYTQRSDA